jgi:hypothetical protein
LLRRPYRAVRHFVMNRFMKQPSSEVCGERTSLAA